MLEWQFKFAIHKLNTVNGSERHQIGCELDGCRMESLLSNYKTNIPGPWWNAYIETHYFSLPCTRLTYQNLSSDSVSFSGSAWRVLTATFTEVVLVSIKTKFWKWRNISQIRAILIIEWLIVSFVSFVSNEIIKIDFTISWTWIGHYCPYTAWGERYIKRYYKGS